MDEFDKLAKTPLDEWILFLKTGDIPENAKANGLPEAREKLRVDKLSAGEQKEYERHMEALRYQRSVIQTGWLEGKAAGMAEGREEGRVEGRIEGLKEGKEEGKEEGRTEEKMKVARSLKEMGLPVDQISKATGLSRDEIMKL